PAQEIGDLPGDRPRGEPVAEPGLPEDPAHQEDLVLRAIAAVRLHDDALEPAVPAHGAPEHAERPASGPEPASEGVPHAVSLREGGPPEATAPAVAGSRAWRGRSSLRARSGAPAGCPDEA